MVRNTRKAQASNYAKTPSLSRHVSLYKFDTQTFALKNMHWSRYVSIIREFERVINFLLDKFVHNNLEFFSHYYLRGIV